MKKELQDWCNRNSQPIETFQHLCMKSEEFSRGKKISLKNSEFLDHLDELAQPFPDISVEHNRSVTEMDHVKKSALTYKATKRIKQISYPIMRDRPLQRNYLIVSPYAITHITSAREERLAQPLKRKNPRPRDYTKISEAALKHEASERTQNLAKVPKNKQSHKYKYRKPQYVKKGALSASASEKTEALAKPKSREDRVTKKHPFDVRKGALTYEASDRMSTISKPKHVTPKYRNPEDMWRHRFDREETEEQQETASNKDAKQEKNKNQDKNRKNAKNKRNRNKTN